MQITWSSASLKTATVCTPSLRAVLMTLQAISPLLAIRILLKGGRSSVLPVGSSLAAAAAAAAPETRVDVLHARPRRAKHRTFTACVPPRSLLLNTASMRSWWQAYPCTATRKQLGTGLELLRALWGMRGNLNEFAAQTVRGVILY